MILFSAGFLASTITLAFLLAWCLGAFDEHNN